MNNLFSIFDPSSGISNLALNWASALVVLLIPSLFWVSLSKPIMVVSKSINFLYVELKAVLFNGTSSSSFLILISLFFYISLNNFFGLLPYVFTSSSHISVTLALALPFWVGYIISSFMRNTSSALAHLVPLGTPVPLIPFMVLIEMVSNFMRPLTLSIRLAANMVAGHLLLVLVSSPMPMLGPALLGVALIGLLSLMVLEFGVSLIQAYVFMTLSSLYIGEVNHPNN